MSLKAYYYQDLKEGENEMSKLKDTLRKVFSTNEPDKPAAEEIDPQEALWQSEEMQKFVSDMKQKMKEERLSYTDLAELKQKTALKPLLEERKDLEARDREVRAKEKNNEISTQVAGEILRSIDLKRKKLQEKINKINNEYLIESINIYNVASKLDWLLPYNKAIEITLSVYKKILDLAPEINKAEGLFGGRAGAPTGFLTVKDSVETLIRMEWNMRDVYKRDGTALEKYFFISLKDMWDKLSKKEENAKIYSEYSELLS